MRAVVVAEPGGPEVLEVREVPDPVPAEGEVVITTVAAGVNRADLAQRQGFYPPPQGDAFHHRLDLVRQEAHDMASQHGGGLSGDEQHALNGELDGLQHAIQ